MQVKKYFLLVVLLIFSFGAMAQKSGSKETIAVKTNLYCDHCKQCESCGSRIYSRLMDIPGVRNVNIRDEEEIIEVTYSTARLTAKTIRDAINDAGFDTDDQPAPAEAVSKLDACCRKD